MWRGLIPKTIVNKVVAQVADFIAAHRERHLPSSRSLSATEMATLAPFFDAALLARTRIVADGGHINDPAFYAQLRSLGLQNLPSFDAMAAITFVDVIVHRCPLDNCLLFHELVHAEQYRQLGLAEFSRRYVNGFLEGGSYEAIPLEKQAYALDARFHSDPAQGFAVADEVRRAIERNEL